jgi:hypothetical protein
VGLKLRNALFRDVDAPDIYAALARFYAARGEVLVEDESPDCHKLLRRSGRWCVHRWDRGWEWTIRRAAMQHVSLALGTPALLVFVYDGGYWGYELLVNGEVVDRFVQAREDVAAWFPFPGERCEGDADVLARAVDVPVGQLDPYLVRHALMEVVAEDSEEYDRAWGRYEAARQALDVKARPGDEFTRFAECAVLDFLRAIGVSVELEDHYVTFSGDVWGSFRVDRR